MKEINENTPLEGLTIKEMNEALPAKLLGKEWKENLNTYIYLLSRSKGVDRKELVDSLMVSIIQVWDKDKVSTEFREKFLKIILKYCKQ